MCVQCTSAVISISVENAHLHFNFFCQPQLFPLFAHQFLRCAQNFNFDKFNLGLNVCLDSFVHFWWYWKEVAKISERTFQVIIIFFLSPLSNLHTRTHLAHTQWNRQIITSARVKYPHKIWTNVPFPYALQRGKNYHFENVNRSLNAE